MRSLRLIVLAALTPITLAAVSFPAPTSASCVAPSFGAATAFSAGNWSEGLAVGDFNGDGHLDLAVTNTGTTHVAGTTVSILLGTGTGSFGAPTAFSAGNYPYSVTVGDFNGDGHLDLAVAGMAYPSVTNTVSILLGDGTGSFGAPTGLTVGGDPSKVAVADFNGDGHLDLAVANYNDDTVSILLGDGTGSVGAATATLTSPRRTAAEPRPPTIPCRFSWARAPEASGRRRPSPRPMALPQ